MYLDKIVVTKRQEVEQLKEHFQISKAERLIADLPATRGFENAIASGRNRPLGLIAEVKKASPSKGLIRPDFHPVDIARAYEGAGADCISVLTDVTYFQGSPEYLQQIRDQVKIPLLRKDFIIDERQIYEARLLGADAVLLIAAILEPRVLGSFLQIAKDLGLDALVEVHDSEELKAVLELGTATLIGVNNRNLRTFETRLQTTEELISLIPKGITFISESGIAGPEDVKYLHSVGAHGILVGEHLMRKEDVGQAVTELMDGIKV
ncbi:indole-3-glycerol phosphate synthase TrpC [Paenibacillus sp. FSL M8-0228]|uniref:indole-3-glycerol phosphate synthase TrpC n=1 Tax=Paenibacillus TaxID=44249 RepID=UPI00083E3FA4|nr:MULTISPECIES: indole-3-glycerol phosphate synthase TrpC [Paenibacillus]MBO3286754.1 indole-3-glycerol phosphate synthase TrpC [Paenibacillus polymyxa]MBP1307173.1 indole-3-glycerol phosphate synthase [Paenibacillus sp. 1182]ODB53295.1 indole-3-glycerol phosphate synthase [Paenibacillus polymyxa]